MRVANPVTLATSTRDPQELDAELEHGKKGFARPVRRSEAGVAQGAKPLVAGMNCPQCHRDTKVTDSRISSEGMIIRRRRACRRCRFRFSTIEEIAILDLTVIKRDGRREPYSRDKILAGLRKAFEKRPITTEEIRRLVAVIERDIQMLRKPEVRSAEIGEIILRQLRNADEVAYVRFASVYESFDDLRSFRNALHTLERNRKKTKTRRASRRAR